MANKNYSCVKCETIIDKVYLIGKPKEKERHFELCPRCMKEHLDNDPSEQLRDTINNIPGEIIKEAN